jgi:hypothetical protein
MELMELSVSGSIMLYILIVVLATLFMRIAEKDGKYRKLWILIAYLIVTLPEAFRYEVGLDYSGYVRAYTHIIQSGSWNDSVAWLTIEPTFRVLCFISHGLINSPQIIFITYAVLTNLFIFLGIYSYRRETSMSSMLFMYTCVYYLVSMNIGRQMVAVPIVFFASKFIIERSFIKYAFFVLLATMFHYSAVVSIAFYFFGSKNIAIKRIMRAITVILPIFVIFLMRPLIHFVLDFDFLSRYKQYGDIVVNEMTIGLGFFGLLIMVLIFIFHYRSGKLRCSKDVQNFILPMTVLAPTLFLLEYKLENFAGRVGLYARIFQIIFLSLLTTAGNRQEEGLKFDYQVLPYVYAGMLFVYNGLIKDGSGCLPYKLWTGM